MAATVHHPSVSHDENTFLALPEKGVAKRG
jgi:hypothetical protein